MIISGPNPLALAEVMKVWWRPRFIFVGNCQNCTGAGVNSWQPRHANASRQSSLDGMKQKVKESEKVASIPFELWPLSWELCWKEPRYCIPYRKHPNWTLHKWLAISEDSGDRSVITVIIAFWIRERRRLPRIRSNLVQCGTIAREVTERPWLDLDNHLVLPHLNL